SAAELNDPATTILIQVPPELSTFLTASRPPSPIARGTGGAGLLAHLIVSKFCDHLPLYRCERMLARFGVTLSRSTLCDWLAQGDAYAGYDALFRTGAVVEVGCWAHVRRKFFEAQKTEPEGALSALGVIRQWYAVERKAAEQANEQELSRPEFEALRLRQEKSVPLLKSFGEW